MSGRSLLNFLGDIDQNVDKDFLKELVERFALDLEKRVKDYSRGMKQKLALIQAFMTRPELVILDEPTSGLDPLMQQEFYNLVEEEKRGGRTIFMSSHNLAEVQKVCDRVGIIRDGSMIVIEEVDTLRRKAGKIVKVSFSEDVEEAHLKVDGVVSISRSEGYFTIAVGENIDSIVKKISEFKINDIVIQEATLEDVFLTYYQGEKEK